MYRLLIVDDEPTIVDGLFELFRELNQDELDICKAYSAFEAVEHMKKMKIDCLLSDIQMPQKTGMQLLDDILYYWPDCKVIFLTGYSEFDYAYHAIQKNVENYILKTEEEEVIVAAVLKALEKVKEESRQKQWIKSAHTTIQSMRPLLKKAVFETLLHEEQVTAEFIEQAFREHDIPFQTESPLLLLVGNVNDWPPSVRMLEKKNSLFRIHEILLQYCHSSVSVEFTVNEQGCMIWFLQLNSIEEASWIDYIKSKLEPVQNDCRERLGLDVTFVLSEMVTGWSGIPRAYLQTRSLIQKPFLRNGYPAIIDLNNSDGMVKAEYAQTAAAQLQYKASFGDLAKYLDMGDERNASVLCADLIENVREEFQSNYFRGLEYYYALCNSLLSYINSRNLYRKMDASVRTNLLLLMGPEQNWSIIADQMTELIRSICLAVIDHLKTEENRILERIHTYVSRNVGGDLSLARIAKEVFFNPSYLSRYYKEHTGRNLSDFIVQEKVNKARVLLADPELKIQEIALRLGFESPSYFTAFFRKTAGMNPQDYRDEHLHRS